MSRILEFHQDEESEIVGRVVMQLHRRLDEEFPHLENRSAKFKKTVFQKSEDTVVEMPGSKSAPDSLPISADSAPISSKSHQPISHSQSLEYSQMEGLSGGKASASKPKRIFSIFLLALIFMALAAYWAYTNLLP